MVAEKRDLELSPGAPSRRIHILISARLARCRRAPHAAKEQAMIESTAGRVPSNTSRDVNLEIKEAFRASVAYFTEHPTAIPHRLKMLDQEWDIERALAMASSGFSLAGLLAGFSGRRRGFVLSLIVQGFYMQHTLQGWCPPLPVLRRM